MKLPYNILLLAMALLMACCKKNPDFRLDAVSDDIGTQNVTVCYVDANGAYRRDVVPAVDGKFSYIGRIDGSTYVEVNDITGRRLGEFIADGGDEIKARFSISTPENISIEGNDDAVLLKEWLSKNRGAVMKGDTEAVNAAVDAFVRENPKKFVSTALLMQYFSVSGHEEQALRLLQSINEKYRPSSKVLWFEQMLNISLEGASAQIPPLRVFARKAGETGADSALTFSPKGARYNLLLLTDNESRSSDSLRQLIETATQARSGSIRIVDMGCDRDTLLWGASLRSLPADYPGEVRRYWLPDGPATPGLAEANPPAIPSFLLTDSLGHLLHRTPSTASMRRFLLHKKQPPVYNKS